MDDDDDVVDCADRRRHDESVVCHHPQQHVVVDDDPPMIRAPKAAERGHLPWVGPFVARSSHFRFDSLRYCHSESLVADVAVVAAAVRDDDDDGVDVLRP